MTRGKGSCKSGSRISKLTVDLRLTGEVFRNRLDCLLEERQLLLGREARWEAGGPKVLHITWERGVVDNGVGDGGRNRAVL